MRLQALLPTVDGRSLCLIVAALGSTLFCAELSSAQSLVPNGDFELHTGCPTGLNQLNKADFWIDPTYWTPDYFHACGTAGYSVPNNVGGHQVPLSDSAYAGIFLYSDSPGREYIETPLVGPLIAGSTYYFEMYMNLLDNSKYSVRNIGVYFSDTLVFTPTVAAMPFVPQIVNADPAYPDTVNWYAVTGYYTAHGGESYLIIGNFDDDANTPHPIVNPAGYGYATVYIDDVSLSISTGVEGPSDPASQVGPVPFSSELTVTVPETDVSEVWLFDMSSRMLLRERFTSSIRLGTAALPSGPYVYAIRLHDGRTVHGLVVKE